MSDRIELNEESLEKVTGGLFGNNAGVKDSVEKTEDSAIKNARKTISKFAKMEKKLHDATHRADA